MKGKILRERERDGDVVPRGDGFMSSSFTSLERVSLALSLLMR